MPRYAGCMPQLHRARVTAVRIWSAFLGAPPAAEAGWPSGVPWGSGMGEGLGEVRSVETRQDAERWFRRPQGEPSGVCTGQMKPQDLHTQ